jgi:glyceraldehyde-3-phosphate dehydrogenase [NAD(P)+]
MERLELSQYFSEIYEKGEVPRFKVFIDGKWTLTKNRAPLISPATGKKIAEISVADSDDADRAIESANRSKEKIRDMAAIDRIELINTCRKELSQHMDEVSEVLSLEAGKASRSARGEINAVIERMRLAMEDSRKIIGEYLPGDWASDTSQKIALVIREPIGVVLGITPFNYSVFTSMAKVIPALLSGNSVIIKPPSADPIAFLMCTEVLRKTGVPEGTLQVITGSGGAISGKLVESEKINMISFTGSTAVGKKIAQDSGLKKLHMELGGKGTAIVLEDADLDSAAAECVRGSLELAGQRCDAISRILVVNGIADKFVELLSKHISDYKFGNPIEDTSVTMGPLINEESAKRVDDMVHDAIRKGAKLVAGGTRNGNYYAPTILKDVPLNAVIANEETFGPVITVIRVKDKEEARTVANASPFGLDSAVFTQNFYSAWWLMKSLQVGNVTLNAAPSHGTAYFPFGGVKDSGQGKEGVGYSIEEMMVIKTIILNLAPKELGKKYSGKFKDFV